MSDPNPNNPQTPPPVPPVIPRAPSPGESAEDREPISSVTAAVDAILRQPRRVMYQLQQPGSGKLLGVMFVLAIVCTSIYGFIVGTFSGGMQLWASPPKITAGLIVSAVICLPSLYIFTCLSGSQARLREVIGFLAGLLLLMGILLVGFSPVAWIFSQSTESVAWMGFLHLLFWSVAIAFGLRFLHISFSHTKMKTSAGLVVWIIIFLLTSLQMMTALRPIIGKADTFFPTEKKFFISHWYDCLNASTQK
ncbi:MAG TPA: hypothetical protein VNU95_04220 [Candidatus Acidoferrales bacterium]|jgi:hypothetical protein|nr:hypothetical protein [Candidatus Acidoferrales bacterium]